MSQHDYIIADADGATFLADLNDCLAAIASGNKGSSRPSTIVAGEEWIDDNTPSASVWTLYRYDGSSDIALGTLDTVAHIFTPANIPVVTTKAIQQGGADATHYVNPALQHQHISAAKMHGLIESDTGGASLAGTSYNISSLTRVSAGIITVNLANPMSSAAWAPGATGGLNRAGTHFTFAGLVGTTASSATFVFVDITDTACDIQRGSVWGFGILA